MDRVVSSNLCCFRAYRDRALVGLAFRLIVGLLASTARNRLVHVVLVIVMDVLSNRLARNHVALRACGVLGNVRAPYRTSAYHPYPFAIHRHLHIGLGRHLVDVFRFPSRGRPCRGEVTGLVVRLCQLRVRVANTGERLLLIRREICPGRTYIFGDTFVFARGRRRAYLVEFLEGVSQGRRRGRRCRRGRGEGEWPE